MVGTASKLPWNLRGIGICVHACQRYIAEGQAMKSRQGTSSSDLTAERLPCGVICGHPLLTQQAQHDLLTTTMSL